MGAGAVAAGSGSRWTIDHRARRFPDPGPPPVAVTTQRDLTHRPHPLALADARSLIDWGDPGCPVWLREWGNHRIVDDGQCHAGDAQAADAAAPAAAMAQT